MFSQDELEEIHKIFEGFDTNGNGDLDAMELQIALQVLDLESTDEEVENLLKEVDLDNNNTVDFSEFVAICAKARFPRLGETTLGNLLITKAILECPGTLHRHFTPAELAEVKEIFKGFDENGNGVLEIIELEIALQVLGVDVESTKIQELVKEVDQNDDGLVNFAEFAAMVARV